VEKRERFASRLGFILIAAGCSIGLGDVWRFPYMDLEDFILSYNLLPIGSLVYLLFCVTRYGWGFDNYLKEVNTGEGVKMPRAFKAYFQWVLPVIILIVLIQGFIDFFS